MNRWMVLYPDPSNDTGASGGVSDCVNRESDSMSWHAVPKVVRRLDRVDNGTGRALCVAWRTPTMAQDLSMTLLVSSSFRS